MNDNVIFALWCIFAFIWLPLWILHFAGILYLLALKR
jgi:hypothetical protein